MSKKCQNEFKTSLEKVHRCYIFVQQDKIETAYGDHQPFMVSEKCTL